MKKRMALLGTIAIASSLAGLAGCKKADSGVSITYLNFKPEVKENYEAIVAAYKKETGKTVVVETAAAGTYDTTLTSKMGSDMPTIFQVNGPVGLKKWKDYCGDLTQDTLYTKLSDQSLALKSDDKVLAVPNTVEGYGIIYNAALTKAYFALTDRAATGANSMDDVKSYATLKKVVEDMTAKIAAGKIGTTDIPAATVKGVFAGTSLKTGEQWRWQTHLLSVSLTGEYGSNLSAVPSTLDWTYNANYRNLFNLYVNNSCDAANTLAAKSVNDSMAEVAAGNAIMVQNGNWGAGQILSATGNKVKSDDLKYLPLYMGDMGDNVKEASQGVCVGTENYLCINSKVSTEQQTAAKDFLHWLYLDNGKQYVAKAIADGGLGFIPTFQGYDTDALKPTDPLSKQIMSWMSKDGVKSLPWTFNFIPSETVKNTLGADLVKYINAGFSDTSWNTAVSDTKASWATEAAAAAK